MSLDVYLTIPGYALPQEGTLIFIRDHGSTRAISHEEWHARFPGRIPVTAQPEPETDTVYSANITHNLGRMAKAVGLYGVLWHPEECFIEQAQQLLEPLAIGLDVLYCTQSYCLQFNPVNGWGDYSGLVAFVRSYRAACQEYPQALVSVSR